MLHMFAFMLQEQENTFLEDEGVDTTDLSSCSHELCKSSRTPLGQYVQSILLWQVAPQTSQELFGTVIRVSEEIA